jgi:hypothetical protein
MMQKTPDTKDRNTEGSQYARTEEELYHKAIALLEKCRIDPRRPGQGMPEPAMRTSPITSEHPRASVTG